MGKLPAKARMYVLGVIVLGGLIAAGVPFLPGAGPRLDIPFAIFIAAALTTQLVGVRVVMPGREGQAWSLVSTVLVAAVLLFPPGNSILLVLITFTAYWMKRRELPWYQGCFNIAQHVMAIALAELVWFATRPAATTGAFAVYWYASAFAAGLTFHLANSLLTTGVISLAARRPLLQVGVISRSNFFRELVLIWLAAVIAELWNVNPWRTMLLTVPLIGLSQMLRTQLQDAERIRRSQLEAEGRAQQLASLNELARALTSSLDFEQIYEALFAQTRKTLDPTVLSVALYDPLTHQIECHVKKAGEDTLPPAVRPANFPIFQQLLETRTPILLDPHQEREAITALSPYSTLTEVTAVTVIPMALAERTLGFMILGTDQPLRTQDLDLISTMASQAAVAVDKAQLFQRERRRSAQLSAITQVSKKIVTIHNVDVLLQQTSRLIEETFGFARVEVFLHGAEARDWPAPGGEAVDIPILYREQTIGVLRVWLRPGTTFSPDDLSMLQTLADEIAVAIENARLYENLQMQMTALEQTQLQLLQSAKLATIGELAAFIAHEINNPLTSVLGYASLVVDETAADDPKRADLEVIEKEALRARAIVRDLLGYARQTDSAMEQTHINDAIESLLPLIRRRAEAQHVTISAQLDPQVPLIMADVNQLKQVFINILNNAIDAMPQGGEVEVTTREVTANGTGPQVEISFQDHGVGIAAEHLEKVFDPFFTTKDSGKGTGLGLPISKRIVERHGGTIEVDSEHGRGTRLTIRLPVTPS